MEADAKGRTENIELYRQIEAERSGVNQQRDAFEQERGQIASVRIREVRLRRDRQLGDGDDGCGTTPSSGSRARRSTKRRMAVDPYQCRDDLPVFLLVEGRR